jgi:prophage DNA circulation protein
MAWRDRLEHASFKGAEFWVEQHSGRFGRRVSVRRLAGRDGSVQQDLGEEPDEFDVTAYLAGEDYDLARDDLERKLKEPGPGPLVIPTRGELWVRVTRGPDTNEERKEGGYCTIRFGVVVEDREAGSLRARPDTSANLKDAARTVRTAATVDFEQTFDASNMPEKYLRVTRDAIGAVTTALRNVQRNIAGAVAIVDDVTNAINELDNVVNTVLSTPSLVATTVIDLVGSVLGLADTVADSIDRTTGLSKLLDASPYDQSASVRATSGAARRLQGLGAASPEEGATDLADRAAKNTRAVYRVTRASALARQAETYAVASFDSANLALSVLENMGAEIDDLSAFSAGDELYGALTDLRAAAAAHLLRTATDLPNTIVHTPKRELPALLIAHNLYGDSRLEGEIVARNRAPHPLFISGDLEILAP